MDHHIQVHQCFQLVLQSLNGPEEMFELLLLFLFLSLLLSECVHNGEE